MKKKVYIINSNHFDLTWRRCFDKDTVYKGKKYISYAKLQEYYILDNIRLAQSDISYKFQIESVSVVQKFLESNSSMLSTLIELYKNGQMRVSGAGYNIIDGNMVQGESIIRNYYLGNTWLKEIFGDSPKLCVRNDAFGNPAQLPQILRGFGVNWVTGLSYVPCHKEFWAGLDKSVVYTKSFPLVGGGGGWVKYAPCEVCNGYGINVNTNDICDVCGGRGIDTQKSEEKRTALTIDDSKFGEENIGIAVVGGEELLPIQSGIDQKNSLTDRYDIEFAFEEDMYRILKDKIKSKENVSKIDVHNGELNSVCTGCYVTRINTKKRVRELENRLLANEALESMLLVNNISGDRDVLGDKQTWEKLLVTMFHDAVTGTHIDTSYAELQSYYESIESDIISKKTGLIKLLRESGESCDSVTVINPTSFTRTEYVDIGFDDEDLIPCDVFCDSDVGVELIEIYPNKVARVLVVGIKPYSSVGIHLTYKKQNCKEGSKKEETNISQERQFAGIILGAPSNETTVVQNKSSKEFEIENEYFKIIADNSGITIIYDKENDMVLSNQSRYRPLEFVLEHDEGSPWATISDDVRQINLSRFTSLEHVKTCSSVKRITYKISLPMELGGAITTVEIMYNIALYSKIRRVDVTANVEWSSFNQRLRVVLPTEITGKHYYDVPYGIVKREPYEPEYAWTGKNGDSPAINWAGITNDDETYSIMLLNKGTPSYKIEQSDSGSVIMLSLLRSPIIPTYLHEPQSYKMTDWDGMRDEGNHNFEFSVVSVNKSVYDSNITSVSSSYNAPLFVEKVVHSPLEVDMPYIISGNAYITSAKVGKEENSIILRVVSYTNKSQQVKIMLSEVFKVVYAVDLMEENVSIVEVVDNMVSLAMNSFEIVSLRIML